jgi:hypothetical protein
MSTRGIATNAETLNGHVWYEPKEAKIKCDFVTGKNVVSEQRLHSYFTYLW